MGTNWTKEQQQVIDLQNRNILVSAAAGSGKTAVLVERILQKMMRKENPVDIDQLLIVTFTRAAAGEMKERLMTAVERQLEVDPDNEHLQRQQTLIHNAQINTIDGFCSYVIRNYFHTIDLDPGYRTADEGELKLLKQDVAKEVLEKNYQNRTPEFDHFVEVFASGKTDEGLAELILKVYEFSMSNPWPEEWLDACKEVYQIQSVEELDRCSWMQLIWDETRHLLEQTELYQKENERIVTLPDGPYMYEEAVADDRVHLERLKKICEEKNFAACCQLLQEWKFTALSRKKDLMVSEEKRDQVKEYRGAIKETIGKLAESYFSYNSQQILEQIQICRGPVEELIQLTKEFIRDFGEKKRKKNILDFTDMEHFALEILVQKQGEELIYTPAAEEFSKRFEEILIDEYQDSNLVQETLLQSISRVRYGTNNIFMVGDVKQSIYRFRLARPELFMEKYDTYSLEESECQRIDLHRNFRSRAQVLDGVNYIFEQIMGKSLGDVEYDEAAALHPGASFPEIESDFHDTELLLCELDTQGESEDSAQELEARMIGQRIQEIVGREYVLDKETGNYRKASYRDCVILLRTISGWAEVFVRVLMEMGIPAYATSRTGYFSALEVTTVLNYLRICDNPLQEIPFTGVLLSPMVGCSYEELAWIKNISPEDKIYACAWKYSQEGENQDLQKKLQDFFAVYEDVRERVSYTPIHELIVYLLEVTGYEAYAGAMPGGAQRRANLDMLIEKAIAYESTSYRGLFNFIRYLEQLQKYQVDFGEVNIVGENEDTVRIISIHKSKGLEFPIVFVAGLGKKFNMLDANASLVIHPELGIGMQAIDPTLRVKHKTVLQQVMQRKIRTESLGEELRVLYVAMTRAKEKLILTGTVKEYEKTQQKYSVLGNLRDKLIPYGILSGAQSYLEWILAALYRYQGADGEPVFVRKRIPEGELLREELGKQVTDEEVYQQLMTWDLETVYDEKTRKEFQEKFRFSYPQAYLQEIPAKVSVSELKHRNEAEEDAVALFPEETMEAIIPDFMQGEKTVLQGAQRGTAYHRILELLDFDMHTKTELEEQIKKLVMEGKITKEMAESAKGDQLYWFLESPLGQRIKKAYTKDQLYREEAFVMSIPACTIKAEWGAQENILVQGIIDLFLEEEDGIVLVDYKTDYVSKRDGSDLVEKYKSQLLCYADALERSHQKKVKEIYIYSFGLGKAIRIAREKDGN